MRPGRRLLLYAAIGAAIGGAFNYIGKGLTSSGFPAFETAMGIALPALVVICVGPFVLTRLANVVLSWRGHKKILFSIWFFGRAGHRWYPMPEAQPAVEWELMHRFPAHGQLVGGRLCRDCTLRRIDVVDSEGCPWMLFRPISRDPAVEWIAGPMIAREEPHGRPPRWGFQCLIVAEAQDPLDDEERRMIEPHLAALPSPYAHTATKRSRDGVIRVRALGTDGELFAAFTCREQETSYPRIVGAYAVYGRQQGSPPPGLVD